MRLNLVNWVGLADKIEFLKDTFYLRNEYLNTFIGFILFLRSTSEVLVGIDETDLWLKSNRLIFFFFLKKKYWRTSLKNLPRLFQTKESSTLFRLQLSVPYRADKTLRLTNQVDWLVSRFSEGELLKEIMFLTDLYCLLSDKGESQDRRKNWIFIKFPLTSTGENEISLRFRTNYRAATQEKLLLKRENSGRSEKARQSLNYDGRMYDK